MAKRTGKIIQSGPFAGHKIEMASTSEVERLAPHIRQLRIAMGISSWWVSDRSTLGDFALSPKQLRELRARLRVPITGKETLVEVAKRLRLLGQN